MEFVSCCKDQLNLDSKQAKIWTGIWIVLFVKQNMVFWGKTQIFRYTIVLRINRTAALFSYIQLSKHFSIRHCVKHCAYNHK